MDNNLTHLESHFAFGENWADFSKRLDEAAISHAQEGLTKLIEARALEGCSFLDIGCGSGLHTLAALRLGAGRVMALDIDPASVTTTRDVLNRFAKGGPWLVENKSVFDLDPNRMGSFDIVYSWGVLHHTGDLAGALGYAAKMVRPGGLIALALYRPTLLDRFWIAEKRWYARASAATQAAARWLYMAGLRMAFLFTGRGFKRFRESYLSRRGMSLAHDVHDWLGGYPYEPIGADPLAVFMEGLGFDEVKRFARGKELGLLGSGCDEFVFRRRTA